MKQQEIIDDMRELSTSLALCEKFSNVCFVLYALCANLLNLQNR